MKSPSPRRSVAAMLTVVTVLQGAIGMFSGPALFFASTFFGLFIGTFVFGFVADKYGRRAIFTFSMLAYCAATLIMSCGVVQPGSADPQKKMAALAGMANAARAANSSTLLPEPAKVD